MYSRAMTDDAEPLKRLAAYVEQRIAELGLEYAEVARLADFSIEVLRKVRNGINARGSTYRKLERALRWETGSVAAILAGAEPTAELSVGTRAALRESEAAAASPLPSRDVELVADLAAATAERLGLTPAEAEEAFRRALRDIEAKHAAEDHSESQRDAG